MPSQRMIKINLMKIKIKFQKKYINTINYFKFLFINDIANTQIP